MYPRFCPAVFATLSLTLLSVTLAFSAQAQDKTFTPPVAQSSAQQKALRAALIDFLRSSQFDITISRAGLIRHLSNGESDPVEIDKATRLVDAAFPDSWVEGSARDSAALISVVLSKEEAEAGTRFLNSPAGMKYKQVALLPNGVVSVAAQEPVSEEDARQQAAFLASPAGIALHDYVSQFNDQADHVIYTRINQVCATLYDAISEWSDSRVGQEIEALRAGTSKLAATEQMALIKVHVTRMLRVNRARRAREFGQLMADLRPNIANAESDEQKDQVMDAYWKAWPTLFQGIVADRQENADLANTLAAYVDAPKPILAIWQATIRRGGEAAVAGVQGFPEIAKLAANIGLQQAEFIKGAKSLASNENGSFHFNDPDEQHRYDDLRNRFNVFTLGLKDPYATFDAISGPGTFVQ